MPTKKRRRCAFSKCKVEFTPGRADQIFHSANCRHAHYIERLKRADRIMRRAEKKSAA